jgi:thiamine transport system substrate-binding protein
MLVVPDPTISSPGLAFLLATIDRFGETGPYTWRDYWTNLRANDVEIVADWGTAYYSSFSATGTGSRPIVVSYASSPPAEVLFSDPPIERATTAVIEDGCFRQVEYAGVLRGSRNRDAARQLIDFMLAVPFQESVPSSMFVFPVNPAAMLPEVFIANAVVPSDPASIDPDAIEQNRERWLTEWIDTVLR